MHGLLLKAGLVIFRHGTLSSVSSAWAAVGARLGQQLVQRGWQQQQQQQQFMHQIHHHQQLHQHTGCLQPCSRSAAVSSCLQQAWQRALSAGKVAAGKAAAGKAAPRRSKRKQEPPPAEQPAAAAAADPASSHHSYHIHHAGHHHAVPRFGGPPRPLLRAAAGVARTQVRPVEQVLRAARQPPAAAAAAAAVQPSGSSNVPDALAVSALAVVAEVIESADWGDFKFLKCRTVLECNNASDSRDWAPADEAAALRALQDSTSSSSRSSKASSGSPSWQQRAARRVLSVSGSLPGIRVGCAYAFTGQWQHNPKWGWSIRADSCEERAEDSDPLALLQQLPGVGAARARVLVQHFGPSMRDIMARLSGRKDETVAALAALHGFTPALALRVKTAWDQQEGMRQVQLQLQQLGLPLPLCKRLAAHTSFSGSANAAAWVTKEPYEPLFSNCPGYTLQHAEMVAAAVGFNPGAPVRGAAHLLDALVAAAKEQKVTGLSWSSLQQATQHVLMQQATQRGWPPWPEQQGLQEAAQLLVREERIVVADDVTVAQLPAEVLLGGGPSGAGAKAKPWQPGWWVQLRSLADAERDFVAFAVAACAASHAELQRLQAIGSVCSSSSSSSGSRQDQQHLALATAGNSSSGSKTTTTRQRRGHTSQSRTSASVQLQVSPLLPQLQRQDDARVAAAMRAVSASEYSGREPSDDDEAQQLLQLNAGQRAVLAYSQLPLLVVTGGPGCGKTHVSRQIVRDALDEHAPLFTGARRLTIAAPTGRAAQRLQEMLPAGSEAARRHSCSTIHRLLKYQGGARGLPEAAASTDDSSSSSSLEEQVAAAAAAAADAAAAAADDSSGPDLFVRDRCLFGRDRKLPSRVRYLIDEVSMLDVPLAGPLFAALTDPPPAARTSSAGRSAAATTGATAPAAVGALRGSMVLVGDVDQLPPVGPGRPIAAALAEGLLPVIDLRHIFRSAQDSAIVHAAHAINAGRLPELATWDLDPDSIASDLARHIAAARRDGAAATGGTGGGGLRLPSDALFVRLPEHAPHSGLASPWGGLPASCVADALCEVVRLLLPELTRGLGLDMRQDVQVLSPRKRGSPIGTAELNRRLQPLLNPPGPGKAELQHSFGRVLREGDRVTHLRNDTSLDVYNGDLGYVERVDPAQRVAVVCYPPRAERSAGSDVDGSDSNSDDDDDWVGINEAAAAGAAASWTDDGGLCHRVTYASSVLDSQLSPAWALTVHKAQGGEFPVVVLPLHASIGAGLLRRQLLYSAVSRSKQLLVVVGTQSALATAVSRGMHPEQEDMARLRTKLRVAREAAGLGTFARAVYGPDGWSHTQ